MTTCTKETPRIYVASLSDYNAGWLLGCWIDATQPIEAIRKQIAAMLAETKEPIAEEWAIHDYENFGGMRLAEFTDIETVTTVAALIDKHGRIFSYLVEYFGGTSDLEEAQTYMEDQYRGDFGSVGEYAEQLIEECWSDCLRALPEFIRYRIDYDEIGRDLELAGDIFTIELDHRVHVFESI